MIKSLNCKETEKIFLRRFSIKFPKNLQRIAYRKLIIIDSADRLDDLRIPPGIHLEKLSGKREGQYSIRISNQWRVCFKWHTEDVYEVEIVDYH